MHTTLYRIPTIQRRSSRRTPILAAASCLVATASIAVTLAVTSAGGGEAVSPSPSATPDTATPDRATLYQRGAEAPQPAGSIDGRRAAERFHHFR
jgi:hypothetical protein